MTTTSKLYPWEIERHLEEARRTYDTRLTELLSEYSGRRSVQAEMIRTVAELAAGRVAEVETFHEQQLATLTAAHAAQVEQLEQRVHSSRERAQQLERKFEDRRTLAEEREAQGEEVQVRIGRSLGGAWRVADLEEVAYRLRCGGAVDDTPVRVTEHTATALVPAPDLVPLRRPQPVEHTCEAVDVERRLPAKTWVLPVQVRVGVGVGIGLLLFWLTFVLVRVIA